MRPFNKKPQMTSEEFKTALREAGLGVAQGWIVDVSGKCPGFASLPSFNKGVLNRNSTLSKAIWERDAEIARRAKLRSHPSIRQAFRNAGTDRGRAAHNLMVQRNRECIIPPRASRVGMHR